MRVFVTAAIGYIGLAVVRELLEAGYEVIGLARSEESAGALFTIGAQTQIGSIEDLDGLRRGAASASAVVQDLLGAIRELWGSWRPHTRASTPLFMFHAQRSTQLARDYGSGLRTKEWRVPI